LERKEKENKKRKPIGYWQNFDNVAKELEPLIDEYGLIPNWQIISDFNPTLGRSLSKHHDGLHAARIRMDCNKKKCMACGKIKDASKFKTSIRHRDSWCLKCLGIL